MSVIERLRRGVLTETAAETRALAAALASRLPLDATLALHGDLGAGKTTFVQGLARGLGVTGPIASPTFTVYSLHRGVQPARNSATGGAIPREGGVLLMHLDAYRLDSAEQVDALLLDDFLVSPYCLAVEWPEKIAAWLPGDAWHLDLQIAGKRHSVRLR
jgi:tRNA threonylcarbamoyladenosine biosynthesis protein TsaE